MNPLKLNPKFSVCYMHFSTMQKTIWSPPKRWNLSTRVLISFGLLIGFEPPNKYLNQTLLLSPPLKEEDVIPTLEKGLSIHLKLHFLILSTDVIQQVNPWYRFSWLPFSQQDLNQGNTFLSEQRQLDNASTKSITLGIYHVGTSLTYVIQQKLYTNFF